MGDAGWKGTAAQREDIQQFEGILALFSVLVFAAMATAGGLTGRAIVTHRWAVSRVAVGIAFALLAALFITYRILSLRHPEL